MKKDSFLLDILYNEMYTARLKDARLLHWKFFIYSYVICSCSNKFTIKMISMIQTGSDSKAKCMFMKEGAIWGRGTKRYKLDYQVIS